jgi:hypothetical protein
VLRALALLLLAVILAGEARAFSPEGATAQVTDLGGKSGLSFGVFGIDTRGGGVNEELPLYVRMATASLNWASTGWSVGISAGQVNHLLPGLLDSSLRLTTLSLGREVTELAGGTLAAELRATRFYADDGTTENALAAGLRWSRKF